MRLLQLLRKSELPGVVSAPVLMVAFLALIGITFWFENTTYSQEDAVMRVTIWSADEQEAPQDSPVMNFDAVNQTADNLLNELDANALALTELSAQPSWQDLEPTTKLSVLRQIVNALLQQQRNQDVIDLSLSLEEHIRDEAGLHFGIGLAYSRLDQKQLAIQAYQKHIPQEPNHQPSRINLASLLLQQKDYDGAMSILNDVEAIASGSKKGKILRLKGQAYYHLNNLSAAIEAYENSILFRPDHVATWRELGWAMLAHYMQPDIGENQGRDQLNSDMLYQAEEKFLNAVALDENKYLSHYDLGRFYFATGQFRKAISPLSKATKLGGIRYDVAMIRALNLMISNRPSSAEKILKKLENEGFSGEKALDLKLLRAIVEDDLSTMKKLLERVRLSQHSPNKLSQALSVIATAKTLSDTLIDQSIVWDLSVPINYYISRSHYSAKQYDRAHSIQKKLVTVSGASSLANYDYARTLQKLGKADEALKYIEIAYKLEPESRRIAWEYSDQLMGVGQPDQATKVLDQLLNRYPRHITTLKKLSDVYAHRNDHIQAIATLEQAISLSPDNKDLTLQYVRLCRKANLFTKALQSVDNLIDIDTADVTARVIRAELLIELNEIQSASDEIKRIFALDPNNQAALKIAKLIKVS